MVRASFRFVSAASILSLVVGSLVTPPVAAQSAQSAQSVKTVFVVAMENTNWEQVANKFTGSQQQIFQNPAAPFINSLVTGTATATINGVVTNISAQTSFATHYHNVLSNPTGTGAHIHPSEPNYIWAEAGSNLGVLNDNQPYQSPGGTNQNNSNHLATYLTNAGKSWKSYQEDIDLSGSGSTKTSTVLPTSQWTVPLTNLSGTSSAYVNPYNGAHQYDYAAKHNPMVFFTDTNGGNNATPTNPLSPFYAPLQQLQTDLDNNAVANYNWITPNQFNDMHTGLAGSFTYNGVTYLNNSTTSGAEKIAQGDNFLTQLIPAIMASQAYKDGGAIVLWWDESEPDGTGQTDDFNHTIGEIVISPLAHPNVAGVPYASTIDYTHSSDLRTMQEIFGVADVLLLDAANAPDLSDLFAPGALSGPYGIARGGLVRDRRTQRYAQQVTITNSAATAVPGPLFMVLDNLSSNASLATANGITTNAPFGEPYVTFPGTSAGLAPGASATVVLEFTDPTNAAISFAPRFGNAVP
jgi:hypothetical protein